MRIGLNISTASATPAGIGNYALQLARQLPLAAREVDWVFFGSDPGFAHALTRENAKVLGAGKSGLARILWEQIALPLAARKERLDLLHGADFSRPVAYQRPTINTIHDLSPFAASRFFPFAKRAYKQMLMAEAIRRSRAVITDSEFSRNEILERFHISEHRVFAIHLGTEPGVAVPYKAGSPFLLFVGTLEARKNLTSLVRAFQILRARRHIPHRLIFAGKPGYGWEEIRQSIQRSGVSAAIEVRGYVGKGELLELYRQASLLVFPSLYEGFGLPVLEAMACGTPVACSRAASLPEVGGDAVAYFDPYSIEEMAAVIEQVLDSPSRQAELREGGPKQAAKFTWDECARKHLDVYRKILNQ